MKFIVKALFDNETVEPREFNLEEMAKASMIAFSCDRRCKMAKVERISDGKIVASYIRPLEQAPVGAKAARDDIALQNAEFAAFDKLAEQVRRHHMTPVVDDDYPEVRQGYERALHAFLAACKANGRTL